MMAEQRPYPLGKCPECGKPTRPRVYGTEGKGLFAELTCGCRTTSEMWILIHLQGEAVRVDERRQIHEIFEGNAKRAYDQVISTCLCGNCGEEEGTEGVKSPAVKSEEPEGS